MLRLAMTFQNPSLSKVAYGIYYQPDLYFKLRTSLQQVEPYDKNSKSTHYTGSLTFNKAKTHVMINAYHKDNALFYMMTFDMNFLIGLEA